MVVTENVGSVQLGHRLAQLRKLAGLKQGALVDKADFDAARERLLESGAFESVGYSYKPSNDPTGYDTTFRPVANELQSILILLVTSIAE